MVENSHPAVCCLFSCRYLHLEQGHAYIISTQGGIEGTCIINIPKSSPKIVLEPELPGVCGLLTQSPCGWHLISTMSCIDSRREIQLEFFQSWSACLHHRLEHCKSVPHPWYTPTHKGRRAPRPQCSTQGYGGSNYFLCFAVHLRNRRLPQTAGDACSFPVNTLLIRLHRLVILFSLRRGSGVLTAVTGLLSH